MSDYIEALIETNYERIDTVKSETHRQSSKFFQGKHTRICTLQVE